MYMRVYQNQIARLSNAVGSTGKELRKQIYIAINKVAKKTESGIAKQLSRDLNMAQKFVKRAVRISRKAMQTDLSAVVEVKKDKRFNLTTFTGTKQDAAGVQYKVLRGGSRKTAKSAFTIRRWGEKTFKRLGKARGPIRQLRGPSPWGRFVVGKMMTPTAQVAADALKYEIERRISYIQKKQSGII